MEFFYEKSKKSAAVFIVGLLLYGVIEFAIFITGHVGSFNSIRRIIANAPSIEWRSATLAYVDTENLQSIDLEPLSHETHADLIVYKLAAAPDNPPYIYVQKNDESYFKYRIPKAAWSM
ncbi:hypothetical protein [Saccharibacillus deserti]|uniref:hypothetical protein n=1 Tax=Saccharibacillus deserti TaxID=1634444 RepID=UPI0015531EC8|nr:hypothetical protein [Saccharibacillus deserti]